MRSNSQRDQNNFGRDRIDNPANSIDRQGSSRQIDVRRDKKDSRGDNIDKQGNSSADRMEIVRETA